MENNWFDSFDVIDLVENSNLTRKGFAHLVGISEANLYKIMDSGTENSLGSLNTVLEEVREMLNGKDASNVLIERYEEARKL